MKNEKKSKILIGCLALLLVMAVGYALFSENITINGTATAKGDFNLSYTCEKYELGGTGTCSIDGETITTTSNLTKPTDVVGYDVKITNTGSIPAVLKTVDSPNNVSYDDVNAAGDGAYFDKTTYLGAYYQVCVLNEDGSCKGTSDSGIGDSNVESEKITLQPNESIAIYIDHMWVDSSVTQPVLPEEGASINYNVTFGFEQVQAQ